jgi:hypothetical protein
MRARLPVARHQRTRIYVSCWCGRGVRVISANSGQIFGLVDWVALKVSQLLQQHLNDKLSYSGIVSRAKFYC